MGEPCVPHAIAGIVLAGGRSSRMGRPKATLEWQGSTLVARVAAVLVEALDGPVVVVGAPGQVLPSSPKASRRSRTPPEGAVPSKASLAGLRAVQGRAHAAYVSATDVPLLQPAFVRFLVEALSEDVDAVVPRVGERMHPLAAVYRASLLPLVERLIAEERMRATDLLAAVRVYWLTETELRSVDPDLDSLRNLNTPEDYAAARALAAETAVKRPASEGQRVGTGGSCRAEHAPPLRPTDGSRVRAPARASSGGPRASPPVLAEHDPLGVRVDVEAPAAQEADERHAEPLRAASTARARRRRDRAEHRDAGDGGLLDELEARAAGHQRDPDVPRGVAPASKLVADELVHARCAGRRPRAPRRARPRP